MTDITKATPRAVEIVKRENGYQGFYKLDRVHLRHELFAGGMSRKTIQVGNFWGLPVNILVFAAITVLLCGGQFQLNGRVIESPTEIIAAIPNTFFLVLGCLAFLIVTVAVNIMANFVAPAFVLSNLAPKYLNFRRAGLISATVAVLILPWNLYNSPLVIVYFLSGLGRAAREASRVIGRASTAQKNRALHGAAAALDAARLLAGAGRIAAGDPAIGTAGGTVCGRWHGGVDAVLHLSAGRGICQ